MKTVILLDSGDVQEIVMVGYEQLDAGGSVDTEDALRIWTERNGVILSEFSIENAMPLLEETFECEFKSILDSQNSEKPIIF